jgi:hypothetical protein
MKPKESPKPPAKVAGFAVPPKHSNKITGEIDYGYPVGFPGESTGRIKLEEIAAKRAFNDSVESRADHVWPPRLRQMLITCAMKPTIAFVKEAIRLGWDAQRICDHRRAYAASAAEWAGLKTETTQDIMEELEASSEWADCDDLLALTNKRSEALQESPASTQKAAYAKTKNPTVRRNSRYEAIDTALRGIAEARPGKHEEVFRALEGRCRIPNAEPFKSAGGWLAGFRKDNDAAHTWLSKRWTRLALPPFLRGPKK